MSKEAYLFEILCHLCGIKRREQREKQSPTQHRHTQKKDKCYIAIFCPEMCSTFLIRSQIVCSSCHLYYYYYFTRSECLCFCCTRAHLLPFNGLLKLNNTVHLNSGSLIISLRRCRSFCIVTETPWSNCICLFLSHFYQ